MKTLVSLMLWVAIGAFIGLLYGNPMMGALIGGGIWLGLVLILFIFYGLYRLFK